MTKSIVLHESLAALPAPVEGTPGRYRIKLIGSDVQGSSGYYARETVSRDVAAAFPKGTKIYFDHPTATEAEDQPERSVRKIAGYLATDPIMESDGAYADAQFGNYGDARLLVEEYRDILGMSIRAKGEYQESERDGEVIREITAITPNRLNSVDLVTVAGAEGAVVEALVESYREAPLEEGTAPAAEADKNNERKSQMEIEELAKKVESLAESFTALLAVLTPLAESLKPEEAPEVDVAAAVEAAYDEALEAGLPQKLVKAVVAEVKADPKADVKASIKDKSDLIESLKETLAVDNGFVREAGITGDALELGKVF